MGLLSEGQAKAYNSEDVIAIGPINDTFAGLPFDRSNIAAAAYQWALLGIGVFLSLVTSSCAPPLQEASYDLVYAAQRDWEVNPVLNYLIVVDVERPGETRRYSITVREGEIQHATLATRDSTFGTGSTPSCLDETQAFPLTVSGLYDLVLAELRVGSRREVLVAIRRRPVVPQRIELGPVIQDGRPIEGTQTTVIVRTFDPLGPTAQPKSSPTFHSLP